MKALLHFDGSVKSTHIIDYINSKIPLPFEYILYKLLLFALKRLLPSDKKPLLCNKKPLLCDKKPLLCDKKPLFLGEAWSSGLA